MPLDAQTILIIFVMLQIALILFKRRARQWHYDSDKPHAWNEARSRGELSQTLLQIEDASSDKVRLYHFWLQCQRLERESVAGAFAELGVYKGETAEWLHLLAPERELYLFDTFEGFKAQDLAHEKAFGKYYQSGYFSDTDLETVQKRLGNSERLHFYAGYFPATTADLPEQSYALVHLDADLYMPTLRALEYFYPRLSPGGVMIIHDYNHIWEGVRQALHEFIRTVPEQLLELADRQGSVMLIRAKDPQPDDRPDVFPALEV